MSSLCTRISPVPLRSLALLLAAGSTPTLAAQRPADDGPYDVVVYGGTSSGVVAAVQCARRGYRTVLVAPHRHLGGLSSSGLGATDIGNKGAIGGMARAFYRAMRRHYERPSSWVHEDRKAFSGRGHRAGEDTAWTFEPKVAEAEFEAMLAGTGVVVHRGHRLDLNRRVPMRAGRITALHTVSGLRVAGRLFLDASYEGDLLAKAGVTYHVGREANATFGETLNGLQIGRAIHHQFVAKVNGHTAGDRSSGPLLPHVGPRLLDASGAKPRADGSPDHGVQAYCYRLCATDVAANRRAWPKPVGYDERDYELLLRNFEAGDLRKPWHPVWMPNRKTDSNNNFAVSTDAILLNHGYPEAGWAERDAILAAHRQYQQGLMWTLANHSRVPQPVRAHFASFGLAKDEFVDNDNWPYQIYVRECRRMVGVEVMTENHVVGRLPVPDPVGLGAYGMDSHNVHRYVDAEGFVRNEGDVQVHGFSPYGISYRALTPRRGECTNLLVPVCVSSTHIAFGSIRMEPVFMVLGQSAAIAADLALRRGVAVQDVDYDELRSELRRAGQILSHRPPARARPVGIAPGSLAGIVVDDEQAQRSGTWIASTSGQPFVGAGYRHDGDARKGETSARFTARLRAGRHDVRIAFTTHGNRATNVPVTIRDGDRVLAELLIDQRRGRRGDVVQRGIWLSLGVHGFRGQAPASVHISNRGTDGHVIVDAVQWLAR